MKKSGRAAVAARDPEPGAKNRPGFDLGGMVGDANRSVDLSVTGASQEIVNAGQIGDARPGGERVPHKASKRRSAVAGVRNRLQGQ